MSIESPSELRPEYLDEFYAEADEHLNNIREGLVLLEGSIGKAQADPVVVEALFRNFHSFKGISAMAGLKGAEALAHVTEDFLRELRAAKLILTPAGLEALMAAAQKLEQIVLAFRSGQPHPPYEEVMEEFQALSTRSVGEVPGKKETAQATLAQQMEEARRGGMNLWRCCFSPTRELDERGINITSVREMLALAGQILQTTPLVRAQGVIDFEFLVALRHAPSDLSEWPAQGISMKPVNLPENGPGSPTAGPALLAPVLDNPFIAPSHVVRVDLNRLDDLMRITGEMVIQRSRLESQLQQASGRGVAVNGRDLLEVNAAMVRSLRELREAINRVRLVPMAEIFARMPFVVRDLARGTQKKVRMTLEGQQTEIDKFLIERLKSPLLHLVRNAFSHGVEASSERLAAGKSPEATICLKASSRGDTVMVQVRDDGKGINATEIVRHARARGMIIPEKIDDEALLKILCTSGFSTREKVDLTSGRGVGMDVVYNTVRELGGNITLETGLGKGTQFTLRLPLTLAITETFIVSAVGQTCAIPQGFVTEVLQVSEEQISSINAVEVVPYRAGILPVVRLSKLFRLPSPRDARHCLLVLSSDRGSVGLLVEKVHGQKEVVVRTLRDPLIQVPGISGATELGDGRPVLILDGSFLTSGTVRPHDTGSQEAGQFRRLSTVF